MHENKNRHQSLSNSSSVKISFTAGVPGSGKTLIALKTALEFSRNGKKTLLIDCDVNSNNTSTKLGLVKKKEFQKFLSGESSLAESVFQQGSFHLLVADGDFILDVEKHFEQIVIDIIRSHENEYDYIIVECPPLGKNYFLNLHAFCDQRVIVITPDRKSLTESYSFIKMITQRFGNIENHIFINKYVNHNHFLKVSSSLSETIENFIGAKTHLFGGIPKFNFDDDGFDTFFLSGTKNEINHNFVKLLLGFTEKAVGSKNSQKTGVVQRTNEQDVH
jgi:flagellar biosynthesis protein FlhG